MFNILLRSRYIKSLIFHHIREIHLQLEYQTFQLDHLKSLSVGYLLTHQCSNLIPLKLGYKAVDENHPSLSSSSTPTSSIYKEYEQKDKLWTLQDFDKDFFKNNQSYHLFLYFWNNVLKDKETKLYFFTIMQRDYYILDECCCSGSLPIIDFLHRRHFNYANADLYAINRNHIEVIKYLYQTPTFQFTISQKIRALVRASTLGLLPIVKFIIDNIEQEIGGPLDNHIVQSVLKSSADEGNVHIVEWLLERFKTVLSIYGLNLVDPFRVLQCGQKHHLDVMVNKLGLQILQNDLKREIDRTLSRQDCTWAKELFKYVQDDKNRSKKIAAVAAADISDLIHRLYNNRPYELKMHKTYALAFGDLASFEKLGGAKSYTQQDFYSYQRRTHSDADIGYFNTVNTISALEYMMEKGILIPGNTNNLELLANAIKFDNLDMVRYLCENPNILGPYNPETLPSYTNDSPYLWINVGARYGNFDIVKYLATVHPQTCTYNAISLSLRNGHYEITRYICSSESFKDNKLYCTINALEDLISPQYSSFDYKKNIRYRTESEKLSMIQYLMEAFTETVQVEQSIWVKLTDSDKYGYVIRPVDKKPVTEVIRSNIRLLLQHSTFNGYFKITKYLVDTFGDGDDGLNQSLINHPNNQIPLLQNTILGNHNQSIKFILNYLLNLNNNNNNNHQHHMIDDNGHMESKAKIFENVSSGTFRCLSWNDLELIQLLEKERVIQFNQHSFRYMLFKTNGSIDTFKWFTTNQEKYPQFYCNPTSNQIYERIDLIVQEHSGFLHCIFYQLDRQFFNQLID